GRGTEVAGGVGGEQRERNRGTPVAQRAPGRMGTMEARGEDAGGGGGAGGERTGAQPGQAGRSTRAGEDGDDGAAGRRRRRWCRDAAQGEEAGTDAAADADGAAGDGG